MRILQVNKFYAPYVGGVETVVRQLAEGLRAFGHETQVLTCNHELAVQTRREQVNEVKVWRAASMGFLFNASLSPTFPLLYRRAIDWADVVHFHVPSPTPEVTHLLLGVPASTQVMVTFHADPGTSRFKMLSPIYSPVLRQLLERADAITATAPANISRTALLQDFTHKTDIIPLATEFEVRPPSEDETQRHRRNVFGGDVRDDEVVILFVGRLAYYKGLTYLLQAMQDVSAHLVVVGDGELREELQREAQSLGITSKVTFAGYVPDEDLSTYYQTADVFVLPSIAPIEAFGIVQLDAMAHGLPVVNTNLPTGVPFVSQHEETGLTVEAENPDALASAINRLVEDSDLRQKMSERAARRARRFTEENMVRRYDELYHKTRPTSS